MEKDEARIANWGPEDALCPVIFDVCCKDFDFSDDQTLTPTTAASLPPTADFVTCVALRPDTTVSINLFRTHFWKSPPLLSTDTGGRGYRGFGHCSKQFFTPHHLGRLPPRPTRTSRVVGTLSCGIGIG